MSKPFASSADTAEKQQKLEVLADGVYALTAEGDPNVGAIEGEDFLVCFEARATPSAARDWLGILRAHTDKPIKYLVLSHYHAVRTLGASAFEAEVVVGHDNTRVLIEERGMEDWESEFRRMPRLFKDPETIPGLTRLDLTFVNSVRIPLGESRGDLVLQYCGRGHTAGDIVAWLPTERVLFAGDLVESAAALYTGDAFHNNWSTTLDRIEEFDAEVIVGGRGDVAFGQSAVAQAIDSTRAFLDTMRDTVGAVHRAGGTVQDGFSAAYSALQPRYGQWPIFEHCMPFNVQRLWDEYEGIDWPRIWTQERDQEVWDLMYR